MHMGVDVSKLIRMKTIHFYSLFLLGTLLITSCKKDQIEEPDPEIAICGGAIIVNANFPMTTGSYWVYEFQTHMPDGSVNPAITMDTVRVVGDTTINGKGYRIFTRNLPMPSEYYLRDSSGYIVNQSGSVFLTPAPDYPQIYNDHYGMIGADTTHHYWDEFPGYESVTNTLGTFSCIQKTSWHDVWPSFGMSSADTLYFSSIGQVQRSYSFFSGAKPVGTLVDYHLE